MLTLSQRLQSASNLLSSAYVDSYSDRMMVGRRAQLGESMVWRSTLSAEPDNGHLTYGEFDLAFFGALVDRALARPAGRREPETFVDVGSGCGRLVLAASCVWPELARAAGVETCADLHMMAVRAQARASLPRCDFVHGDALQAMREGGPLDDATVVFCYSSAWASEGGALTDFSELVGCCCLPGCRVVVTDKWLECDGSCGEFALIDEMEGPNRETGGSVGYIYEVVRSQRGG